MFEYLRYWIHTNIFHINHNTKFVRFSYKPMKIKIYMKLYEPIKNGKYVM